MPTQKETIKRYTGTETPDIGQLYKLSPEQQKEVGISDAGKYFANYKPPTTTTPPATDATNNSGTGNTGKTDSKVYRSQTKNEENYSNYVGDQISGNQKTEQQIYNEQKNLAQSQIDAIEAEFNAALASETRINQEAQTQRAGQTRALAAASGLVGSQEAGERQFQTAEVGRKIQGETEAKLQAQKASKIAALLGEVRKDASEKYEAQKKALAEGYEAQRELDKETVTKAQEQAGYLLKAGVDFEALRTSPEYADDYKYLVETGFNGNENQFKSWYVANKPEKNLVSKTPQINGSKATWFEIQSDGSIKAITVDSGTNLEDPDIQVLQGADGFFSYDKKTGAVKSLGIASKTTAQTLKDQINKAYETVAPQLSSVAGTDGYVAPEDYKKAKRAWVESGFPSQDFDKQFVSYINPTNTDSYGFDKATFEALKKPMIVLSGE